MPSVFDELWPCVRERHPHRLNVLSVEKLIFGTADEECLRFDHVDVYEAHLWHFGSFTHRCFSVVVFAVLSRSLPFL